MKLKGKRLVFVNCLTFLVLSGVVFYISFTVEENSLSRSLVGLLFVLFIGGIATVWERRIESKNDNLLRWTIVLLLLVNVSIFVILIPILSKELTDFLTFAIPYTLVYSLLTYVQYKLKSE